MGEEMNEGLVVETTIVDETDPQEDQALLDMVLSRMEYEFQRDMLVKPLPEEYIEKEVTKPVETGKKDENGFPVHDTETTVESTLANFRKGIVLAIPSGYQWQDTTNHPLVGDIVAYSRKGAVDFDLFKDTQIVNPYNVVGWIKAKK